MSLECQMPDKKTIERAKEDAREGKSASTQAGEFVRQEMDHIREGKHGARSTKQAIAIGLSEARRAGIKVPAGKNASAGTRKKAEQDEKAGEAKGTRPSATRSGSTKQALQREPTKAASKAALSRQAKKSAANRSASSRSASATRAAQTRQRASHGRGR
jgi:hypothetical protein